MKSNILIIAPHPDDEILGCGGIIAKFVSKGHDVHIAVVTNGHKGAPELFSAEGTKKVQSEARRSHEFLGVSQTFFLDFPVLNLASQPTYKLSLAFNKLIKEIGVDTLYIPHRGDIHEDHKIVFESALVSARPINKTTVRSIYAYETLSETEWAAPFGNDVFIPNVFEDITDYMALKQKAFEFFTTQAKKFPHPRSSKSIEALSHFRGATVGYNNAEAFMLIRDIRE